MSNPSKNTSVVPIILLCLTVVLIVIVMLLASRDAILKNQAKADVIKETNAWVEGYNAGYRDSVWATYSLTNKYRVVEDEKAKTATLYMKQEVAPIVPKPESDNKEE